MRALGASLEYGAGHTPTRGCSTTSRTYARPCRDMHLSGRFPPNCAAFKARSAQVGMLVLNLDNGPESHSHRTQFMGRLVGFVARHGVSVHLAYYPPYHSTYNPAERCWGPGDALERPPARLPGGGTGLQRLHDLEGRASALGKGFFDTLYQPAAQPDAYLFPVPYSWQDPPQARRTAGDRRAACWCPVREGAEAYAGGTRGCALGQAPPILAGQVLPPPRSSCAGGCRAYRGWPRTWRAAHLRARGSC